MKTASRILLLLGAFALSGGCDSKTEVKPPAPEPMVSYSTLSPERKSEFVQAATEALKAFDGLYGKITVTVEDSAEGPVVYVAGNGRAKQEQIERLLGVAVANFEFHAPGMRFMALGDSRWKLLFPATMQVAAAGKFNLMMP